MVLTKSDILNGAKDIIEIEIESLDGTIQVRPLTQEELNKIENIESKALGEFQTNEKARRNGKRVNSQMTSQGKINVIKTAQASQNAKILAVKLSLSVDGEEWTDSDVKSLPGKVFYELYEKIREINYISEDVDLEQDVDDFLDDG